MNFFFFTKSFLFSLQTSISFCSVRYLSEFENRLNEKRERILTPFSNQKQSVRMHPSITPESVGGFFGVIDILSQRRSPQRPRVLRGGNRWNDIIADSAVFTADKTFGKTVGASSRRPSRPSAARRPAAPSSGPSSARRSAAPSARERKGSAARRPPQTPAPAPARTADRSSSGRSGRPSAADFASPAPEFRIPLAAAAAAANNDQKQRRPQTGSRSRTPFRHRSPLARLRRKLFGRTETSSPSAPSHTRIRRVSRNTFSNSFRFSTQKEIR